jgi:GNAT superfamily N-acetyltransferase
MFAPALRYAALGGEAWADDEPGGVAVWLPPRSARLAPMRALRGRLPLSLLALGGSTGRWLRFASVAGALRRRALGDRPHWYLEGLGVEPLRQRQGIGSALVRVGTDRADAAGVACGLVTSSAANLPFYARHGFDAAAEDELGPARLWALVREPRYGRGA